MTAKLDPWPDLPDTTDENRNKNALLWETFCDFEACQRDSKIETLASFLNRWELSLEKMEVLGVVYPDEVLVFKLSYACRLDFTTVEILLNTLSYHQLENGRSCSEKIWERAKEILCHMKFEEEENETEEVNITELKEELTKSEAQDGLLNDQQENEDTKILFGLQGLEVQFDINDQVGETVNQIDSDHSDSSAENDPESRLNDGSVPEKFACRPCAKSFTSQDLLENYISEHKSRKCEKCGKVLVSEHAFSRHMKISRCAVKENCPVCNKSFNPSTLKKHLKLHQTKNLVENIECPNENCDIKFLTNVQLKKHVRDVHKNGKTRNFSCDICDESFTCELYLNNHHKAKHEVLFCESCGKSGEGVPRLSMQHHITYCAKAYHCNLCHKAFKTQESYDKHTANHTEHTCQKCNKVFPSKKRFAVHLKQSSCAEKVMCKFCGEYFNPGGIKRHEGKHKSDQSYQCPRDGCEQSYWNKLELDRHLLMHDGIRNFHCDQCESKFVTQLQLRRHIQTIHLRSQSRECHICAKSFQNKSKLKVHIRSHTGEKPFKCEFCDKAFSKKERCKIHIDRVHKGIRTDKPTRCELCHKEFTKRWNWSQHMKKVHKLLNFSTAPQPPISSSEQIPDLVKVEKAN